MVVSRVVWKNGTAHSSGSVGVVNHQRAAHHGEDRYGTRSTIVTSQLPPTQYHDYIGEPTLADSICDRLLHNSHPFTTKGGQARHLTAGRLASLRSDRDPPIGVITMRRSG